MDYFESEIGRLVRAIEECRSNGEPIAELEREIRTLKAQHGPRRVTGTAEITAPIPTTDR